MNPDLEKWIRNLKRLQNKSIVVIAEGHYPTRAATPVQHVSKYQNDGTDRGVTPAKFVEKAERENWREWKKDVGKAILEAMDGDNAPLKKAAKNIADDIGKAVDRIDTGRLKKSMRGKIE
jgi:hypothetical protein